MLPQECDRVLCISCINFNKYISYAVLLGREETKQVVKVNEELSENLRSTSRMLENETDRRKCLEHILGQTSQVLKEALRV